MTLTVWYILFHLYEGNGTGDKYTIWQPLQMHCIKRFSCAMKETKSDVSIIEMLLGIISAIPIG